MSWGNYEDQTMPCRGCSGQASTYEKGRTAGFCSEQCYENAHQKSIKRDVEGIGLPKFADVYAGRGNTGLSQNEFTLRKLKKALGSAEMLGDQHRASEIRQQITTIGGSL